MLAAGALLEFPPWQGTQTLQPCLSAAWSPQSNAFWVTPQQVCFLQTPQQGSSTQWKPLEK